ncbi:MAG: hypothetical protein ACYCP0_10510 [Acidiferrobacteraceae bacterium]
MHPSHSRGHSDSIPAIATVAAAAKVADQVIFVIADRAIDLPVVPHSLFGVMVCHSGLLSSHASALRPLGIPPVTLEPVVSVATGFLFRILNHYTVTYDR